MYARDLPEDSTAFWACLRRAFPTAMADAAEYEAAVANVALVYAAGTETTASAVASTLALLALHPPTLQRLEQACPPPQTSRTALATQFTQQCLADSKHAPTGNVCSSASNRLSAQSAATSHPFQQVGLDHRAHVTAAGTCRS